MNIFNKKESIILFFGDIFFLSVSIWVTLFLRYFEKPSNDILLVHLIPFSILFIIWIFVFFIAGLYEKRTSILKSRLSNIIANTQVVNIIMAVLFFYFIPYFGITPKTNLFIYLVVSSIFIFLWRIYIVPFLNFRKREDAILIGSGKEVDELSDEVNNNPLYNLRFVSVMDPDNDGKINFRDRVMKELKEKKIRSVVVDLENDKIKENFPYFYNMIFSGVKFIDMYRVYEDVFDRVPLSSIKRSHFLEEISPSSHPVYSFFKRVMDIMASVILGIFSLIIYPFVYLAIKIEDSGPVFINQKRIGQWNRIIYMTKFRSMRSNDNGAWIDENKNKITRVGNFIRKTRIDELPQLWNILRGDISLIGPRPDIIDLGKRLVEEIPYYSVRNLVKPGLSGWAQIKQGPSPQSVEETKLRLSYDLYYIKNRSIFLDLKIALKTIKTLLSRYGR